MLLLVISPQERIRAYLGNVCRHFGYTVEFAYDAVDALDRLPALHHQGMILLDGLDADFAASELSTLRRHTPECDVVILSDEANPAAWTSQGARGVLMAPILPSRLKVEMMRRARQAA